MESRLPQQDEGILSPGQRDGGPATGVPTTQGREAASLPYEASEGEPNPNLLHRMNTEERGVWAVSIPKWLFNSEKFIEINYIEHVRWRTN